jgi:CheY-like chemotaxis protein
MTSIASLSSKERIGCKTGDSGARFITVDVQVEKTPTFFYAPLTKGGEGMGNLKILVVDDSKSARFAIRSMLKKSDVAVELAESGEEALETLKKSKPDAIFMDHMMPGMDGFETTKEIKKDPATATIPVFMCTSNEGEEYIVEAKSIGAMGILPKPATPERIAEVLAALEADHQARQAAEAEAPAEKVPPAAAGLEPAAIQEIARGAAESVLNELLDTRIAALKSELAEIDTTARTAAQGIDDLRNRIAEHAREEASSAAAAIQDALQGQIAVLGEQTLAAARSEIVPAATASAKEAADSAVSHHSNEFTEQIGKRLGALKAELEAESQQWLDEAMANAREDAQSSIQAHVTEAAETAVNQRAAELRAQIDRSLEERLGAMKTELDHTVRTAAREAAEAAVQDASQGPTPDAIAAELKQRMNLMAAVAGGVGVLAALVVLFIS